MKARSRSRPKGESPQSRTKAVSAGRTRTSEQQPLTAAKGADVGLGRVLKMSLDPFVMDELRAGLDKIAAGRDKVPLTREDLLATLRMISEVVRPVTHTVIGYIEKTDKYVAVGLLERRRSCFRG
jgi:hypothetical protein